MPVGFEFTCPLPNGLHARPATALAEAAASWPASSTLTNLRTGMAADATSVLEIVAAGILNGDPCRLECRGEEEAQACAALRAFIEDILPNCDEPLPVVEDQAPHRIPRTLDTQGAVVVTGIPASPGLGLGRVVRLSGLALPREIENQPVADPDTELGHARSAFDAVAADLRVSAELPGSPAAEINKALLALVTDPGLFQAVTAAIRNQHSGAAHAVVTAITGFCRRLRESGSIYLKERIVDLEGIGVSLLRHLPGAVIPNQDLQLTGPSILLAPNLAAGQLLNLDRNLIQGLALEAAGTTSHVVILARSFGLPGIAGLAPSAGIAAEAEALIDGTCGLLVAPVTPGVRRYYERERRICDQLQARFAAANQAPAATRDGRRIEIAANIGSAAEVETALANGAEGVGLFRTEMLFSATDTEPSEDSQYADYRAAVAACAGRPVIIRTLDIGGDKPLPYLDLPAEANPFLGIRGIRIYERCYELFRRQLRAIVRASAAGNAWVMAPMVVNVAEARWFREEVTAVQAELAEAGIPFAPRLPVGIMVETPAAALMIDALSAQVDFFSVGTNDLTQYLLAVERGNPAVEHLYEALHPALLRTLSLVTERAKVHGKWVGICGELARNPLYAPLLIGLDFDELSMSAPAIPAVRAAVVHADHAACRALAQRALACADADQVWSELAYCPTAPPDLPLTAGELITVHADCRTKAEAIRELCALNYLAGRCRGIDDLEAAVWDREATYSTGLGYGIAIPHCKSEAVRTSSLAMLKLAAPVEWESLDDRPVDVVIMLTMPPADPGNRHLKVFAALSRRLMHEEFRDRLRAAEDADSILSVLAREFEPEESKGNNDA
ncbi:phosphoenolpyruvate--protein phosphotransferase [bacterium]|nr:phosphoenolpyruvate--protein phosphotransferase [bacterium]